MGTKSLQILKNFIFTLMLFFILLLFCEIGYRIYEFSFYRRLLRKQDTFVLEPLPNDRILQYKLKPNGHYLFAKKIPYKINSKGLRDYEFDCKKTDDYKIVILGDSTTFGWGVELEQSYPKVIESLLRSDGYKVMVVNAGVYGYNTQQEIRFLKKEILPHVCPNPDLVIVAFDFNDTQVQGVMPRHPYINHCESYWNFWFPEFIKSRINRIINKNKKINTAGFAKSGDFYPIKVRLVNPIIPIEEAFSDKFLGWRRCKEALLEFKKLSQEKKFDLLVIITANFVYDFKNYGLLDMHTKVKKYCKAIGIGTLDLFPYFKGLDNAPLQNIEINDCHANAKGHAMIAAVISDYLKAHLKNKSGRRDGNIPKNYYP